MRVYQLLALAAAVAIAGCGPKLPVRQIAAGGPYQAEVLPVGPPTWSYTVTTDRPEGIVTVEVITPLKRDAVMIEPTSETVTRPTWVAAKRDLIVKAYDQNKGVRRMSFNLVSKEASAGVVYLRITDENGLRVTMGPIAGPVPAGSE